MYFVTVPYPFLRHSRESGNLKQALLAYASLRMRWILAFAGMMVVLCNLCLCLSAIPLAPLDL